MLKLHKCVKVADKFLFLFFSQLYFLVTVYLLLHILQGRGGKGNIYVWSSGNGGVSGDSCAYDGYVNNIYTISVAAVGKNGDALYGGEECSANMVTAYSKDGGDDDYPIVRI